MEFKPLFYACLVLCVIVFFQVLITARKNSLLKICLLLILLSLFVMNYFAYANIENRLQFVLVKSMRPIYVSSAMLAIIYLVTPRIPRWIIGFITLSVFFIIGLRIFYFNEIAIENLSANGTQIFSVGNEFYKPIPVARFIVLMLGASGVAITYYYYRLFLLKMNKEDIYYTYISRWIISMVVPFFLLVIFGALGVLRVFHESACPWLFSIFSCTVIFSILFRPKFLNTETPMEAMSEISLSTVENI